MRKILLVNMPYLNSYYAKAIHLPIGLGILSEILLSRGIEHEIYDMQLNASEEKLFSAIERFKPDDAGFSMMSFRYIRNYNLINKVKKQFPSLRVIVGGPHASTFREKILEECESVDVVSLMEGEETVVELCGGVPLDSIKGIIYRDRKKIITNGNREYLTDLDIYPFPKFSKFEMSRYPCVALITSRGCPAECVYCPVVVTMGRKWRAKRADDVIREIAYWVNKGYRGFSIQDDNFTFDRRRVIDICNGIKEKGFSQNIEIWLPNGVRADKVDMELLKTMREGGFTMIAFGVESGNDSILTRLCKGETLQTIENAIKEACDLGYQVRLTFVLGTPGETEKEVYDSIKFAKKYPVVEVNFYHLIPFLGTRLYRWAEENNSFRFKAPDFLDYASHWINEPLFTTPELDVKARKRFYIIANKMAKRHTHRVQTRMYALKVSKKYKMPFWISMIISHFNVIVFFRKNFHKTLLWRLAYKIHIQLIDKERNRKLL